MQTLVVTIEKSENKASWQISPSHFPAGGSVCHFFNTWRSVKAAASMTALIKIPPHDFKYRGRFSLFFENYS